MTKKKKQKAFNTLIIIPIITALIVIVFAGYILYSNHLKKEEKLTNRIQMERRLQENKRDVVKYLKEREILRIGQLLTKEEDLMRLSSEEYSASQITMWNTDELTDDWYTHFFGIPMIYAHYECSTPEDIYEYLTTILESGNALEQLYIGLDLEALRDNYYNSVYYDMEILPFEEFIYTYVIEPVWNHPEVNVKFIFPNHPLSYWEEYTEEEREEIYGLYYTFAMYLHICPNATMAYTGAEEWLIANENNFVTDSTLEEELSKTVYLYLYTDYSVVGPEIAQKHNAVENFVKNKISGGYSYSLPDDTVIVCLGDSTFAYPGDSTASIPNALSFLTGAETYNLAIGGTSGATQGNGNFEEVSKALADKSFASEDETYVKDANIFYQRYSDNDNLIFVLQYGTNDYFCGYVLENEADSYDTSTFLGGMRTGIETLKTVYPNAKIILSSPYRIGRNAGGTELFSVEGATIPEISEAIEKLAVEEGCIFNDFYNTSGITQENCYDYLADETHPNFAGDFLLAIRYAELLTNSK